VNDAAPLLNDFLRNSAERWPAKIGIVSGSRRASYAAVLNQARALAWQLRKSGVRRGDRVLICAENSVDTVVAFWGVLEASAVAVPISPLTKSHKLLWLINDSRASALIIDARTAVAFAPIAQRSRHELATFIIGDADEGVILQTGAIAFSTPMPSDRSEEALPRECIDVDLATIIYTSGSTGEPKGVMLTHRNMLSAAASICGYLKLHESDTVLSALPMAFDYGLYQVLLSARQGAILILERSLQLPTQVALRAAAERATVFPGVPTTFGLLAELKDISHLFSTVRVVTSTGAALSSAQVKNITTLFPHAHIFSMYGLTECKRCTYLPPDDLLRKPESVGIAIPNTELWLVNEEGRRVSPGAVGELVIRGATVMRGYWERPEETAKALRPGPLPGEKVLYTGDYCRLDDEGYLYFVGRKDDIIKSRGEKVAPAEVEATLHAILGVKEAAVVGIPDKILGQAVEAYVVLEAGACLTEIDLKRECRKRLEAFMVPKSVKIRDVLPKLENGKVNKKDLI
jgi:amino acid adenylation domain-containing protein